MIAHRRLMRKLSVATRAASRGTNFHERELSQTHALSSLLPGHDAVVEARRNIIDFFYRFGRDVRAPHVDKRLYFNKGASNFADDRQIKLGHRLQSRLKVNEQVRLVQQLSAFDGKMFRYHRGQ